jgi:anti-anti-sigma factor
MRVGEPAMTSPDFAPSEHRLAQRRVEGEINLVALGSRGPRAAGGRRRDPMAVSKLVVGTELMTDATVVSLAGEIDLSTMEQFAAALRMHLDDGAPIVVIDLAEVGFASADSVRVLLTALRQARRRGVIVRVVLSPAVRRVVTLLGAIAECEAASVTPAT